MFKRTLLSVPLAALLVASLLSGCNDKSSEPKPAGAPQAAAAKPLRVGTNPTFPPFEFQGKEAGAMVGFDLDLMQAIAKKLGRPLEMSNLSFDGLIPALNSGNIDLAIAGISITPERQKNVEFSSPYYTAGLIVVVRPDEGAIKGIEDLKNKNIAVQIGTTGANKASTVPGASVKQFNENNEAFLELTNKGADAVIIDQPVAAYYLVQGGKGKIVGPKMEAEDYGIAAKKGNAELIKQVNGALEALKKDGEFDKIYKKWFGA